MRPFEMADGQQYSLVNAHAVEMFGRRLLRQMLQMTPDAITGPLNIAVEGEWMGHPEGPIKFDAEMMGQLVQRFDAQTNPMMVDYDHLSIRKDMRPGDARAAGWVQSLEVKQGEAGAELWAQVEWTKPAAEMIRAGEYRYCSPVIDNDSVDRKSGEKVPVEMFNVAITNMPFLDGQHPIALSRLAAAAKEPSMPMPEEEKPAVEIEVKTEGEGEGEPAKEDDKAKGLPFAEEPPPASEVAPKDEKPAAPEGEADAPSAEKMLAAFVEQCMATSGGSMAAVLGALSEGDLADQIGGLIRNRLETTDGSASDAQEIPMSNTAAKDEKGEERAVLLSLAKEVGSLRTALSDERKAREEAAKRSEETAKAELAKQNDARIEAMMADGRLSEDERATARLTLSRDPELFEAFYGKRVAGSASPVGRRQVGKGGETVDAADADSKRVPLKDEDVDLERDLAKLTAPERKAFDAMVDMRKDPKATLRRMLSSKSRDGVRVMATRHGIAIPE